MEEETRRVIFETNGKTYKELYDNIIEENLRNPPPEGENTIEHHIRPRSISPDLIYSRKNLVRLTEKVHLLVHYLLWQYYKRETDDRDSERKMCYAFWNMVHRIEWRGDMELGWISDKYEELRVDFRKNNPLKRLDVRAKFMGDNNPSKRPEVRELKREWWKNNPEARVKFLERMKNPEVKEKHSETMKRPDVRAKLSEAISEALKNPEVKAKMSEARRNWLKNNPDKHPMKNPKARAKISEAMKEMRKRPDVRAKFMGDNNPSKRPEVRAKMSEAMKGDNNPSKRPEVRAKKFKKVLQYSIDGTFVTEYPSIKEAVVKTNSHQSGISQCCAGKLKTHNGFVWKYA